MPHKNDIKDQKKKDFFDITQSLLNEMKLSKIVLLQNFIPQWFSILKHLMLPCFLLPFFYFFKMEK